MTGTLASNQGARPSPGWGQPGLFRAVSTLGKPSRALDRLETKRMRIAFIGQKGIPATYGGVEDYVEKIAVRLVRRGHEVTVFCRPHYTSANGWYKGVRLRKVSSIPTKHLDAITHTLFCSIDSLSREFDLVNYQALGPSTLSFLPRLTGGTKVVATIHALDWQREKWSRWARLMLRLAEYPSTRFPDKIAVVSPSLKEYFEGKGCREVVRIPTGVDPPVFRRPARIRELGLTENNFILFLNRLVPEKGCHFLIEAFSRLKTDKKLFIAGDGKFADDYKRILHEWKSDRIIFGGFVEEDLLEELYSNCCLFVLPSMLEGVSQTGLRALSYGKPVLASDIRENLDALGEHALFFKNKNVGDLKNQLQHILRNGSLAEHHGGERWSYVRANFSWDRAAEELEKLFLHCLAKK
jgi:glycosyltransferase involved in cell wall biosynthesis